MKRKGLGKGLGKGYYNIVPMDSHIHSLSAKGVKTKLCACKNKTLNASGRQRYKEFEEEWGTMISLPEIKEIENLQGSRVESIEEWYPNNKFLLLKLEDGTTWVFGDYDDAEALAKEQVEEDLEENPEYFTQSWLQNYITMSDTDRHITAQEESDYYVDDMTNEEILEEDDDAQMEWDEIQEKIDEEEDEDKIAKLEAEQEKIVDDAREKIREEKYDEIYDELEDPVAYFVEDRGIYTIEQLMKAPFIHIDIEEASEDAIRQDGWTHFLSHYDGSYEDIGKGKVIWRED